MSQIYMFVRADARGVGVALFKQSAGVSVGAGSVTLGLSKGELHHASVFPTRKPTLTARVFAAKRAKAWAVQVTGSMGGACCVETFVMCKGDDIAVAALLRRVDYHAIDPERVNWADARTKLSQSELDAFETIDALAEEAVAIGLTYLGRLPRLSVP